MADIRLITIQPLQAVPGVQPPQVSQGSNPAPAIGSMALGTILSGFIVNRDAGGNPVLRTDSGDITFSSNFFLKIGSEVTIRIENSLSGSLAHILTVDGQPPEVAETVSNFSATSDVVSQNLAQNAAQPEPAIATNETTAPLPVAPQQPSITVTGTLISTPPTATSAQSLPIGTQLSLNVTTLSVPAEEVSVATTAPVATSPQTNTASYSAYARAAGTPLPAAPIVLPPTQSVLPVADTNIVVTPTANTPAPVAVTVIAPPTEEVATPPAQPTIQIIPAAPPTTTLQPTTPVPIAPQPGQSISATVIGNEPTGEAVVQTSIGVIRLQPGTVLPVGSSVTFDIATITPPPAATIAGATSATTPAPLTALAQEWGSLQQIVGLLTQSDTPPGNNFIQNTLPTIGNPAEPAAPHSISSGLMLFMSALRGSDFNQWLGRENVQWLQDHGHAALVAKAEAEFTGMARQFSETPPQHWQALFFPVVVAGELQQARLFVKRDRERQSGNQPQKKTDDTRFVVEVDLTQLGEMQMDGFVRRAGPQIQFDMVIRSLQPLPVEMQRDLLLIYSSTGELTGYKGSLTFQAVREFPVNPMEEIVAHAMEGVVA